jgi:flagellin-like hook-associated protein FlgL
VNTLAFSGRNLFAGTSGAGLFLSTNNGGNWTEVNNGLTNNSITDIAVSSSLGGASTILFAATSGGGIFVSTDSGTSWSAANTGLTNKYVTKVVVFSGSGGSSATLFASTTGAGIFLSTDSGASWNQANTGLTNNYVFTLSVADVGGSGIILYAGTSNGVWKRPLLEMTTRVEAASTGSSRHFTLNQNYPNPFNPTTMISFNIPTKSYALLKVFDLTGREVATVVSEQLPAGLHSRQWNAEGLPSGIYFYRLQAGKFTQTKKLVFLR